MVKARATDYGEDYDYCRGCKKELKEIQSSGPSIDFINHVKALGKKIEEYEARLAAKTDTPRWTIKEVSPGSTPICYLESSSREDHQASARSPFCACGVLFKTLIGWERHALREQKVS